jgi:predicted transcriptional regulator
MAITSIKVTYSLDEESVRRLERLAARRGLPKSEVIRLAIETLDRLDPEVGEGELEALDALQTGLGLTPDRVEEWLSEVRGERVAFGRN